MTKKILSILKFIIGVLLLPFVISFTIGFSKELLTLEKSLIYFLSGIISYLVLHLFIGKPLTIYRKGQRILEIIFKFFSPLIKVAGYLLPIYTLILFGFYLILSSFIKDDFLKNSFFFLFSFSLTLHLVITAETLRAKEDLLKANYIFGYSLIYILNLILISFGLNLISDKFSFVKFFNNTFPMAKNIFGIVFKQLFL